MYLPVTAEHLDELRLALRQGVTPGSSDAEALPRRRSGARQGGDPEAARARAPRPEADELPEPLPDLRAPEPQLPRAPLARDDFGRLHRYERGGVVHGLARVRSFCQDDAHIFCTPDQLTSELTSFLHLFYSVYAAFKFTKIEIKLATRPEKRIGTEEQWDAAEKALADALRANDLASEISPGRARSTGPSSSSTSRTRSSAAGSSARSSSTTACPIASSSSSPDPTAPSTGRSCSTAPSSARSSASSPSTSSTPLGPSRLARARARGDHHRRRGAERVRPARRRAPHLEGAARPRRPQPRQARREEAHRAADARPVHRRRRRSRGAGGQGRSWSRDTQGDLGAMPLEEFAARLVAEATPLASFRRTLDSAPIGN